MPIYLLILNFYGMSQIKVVIFMSVFLDKFLYLTYSAPTVKIRKLIFHIQGDYRLCLNLLNIHFVDIGGVLS